MPHNRYECVLNVGSVPLTDFADHRIQFNDQQFTGIPVMTTFLKEGTEGTDIVDEGPFAVSYSRQPAASHPNPEKADNGSYLRQQYSNLWKELL